jgi:hypothetical protein
MRIFTLLVPQTSLESPQNRSQGYVHTDTMRLYLTILVGLLVCDRGMQNVE